MINIALSAYKLLQPQLPDKNKVCLGSILWYKHDCPFFLLLNFIPNFLVLIKSQQSQREGILGRKQTAFHKLNNIEFLQLLRCKPNKMTIPIFISVDPLDPFFRIY